VPDEDPRIVDLSRYRRVSPRRPQAKPRVESKPAPRARSHEALVGGHRHAKLILAVLAAAVLLLAIGPALLR
jgi:hypothetical protein